jgi:hypothetical protein
LGRPKRSPNHAEASALQAEARAGVKDRAAQFEKEARSQLSKAASFLRQITTKMAGKSWRKGG